MKRPLLVLLPGLLCDETVWADQAAALADRADIHIPAYHDGRDLGAMAEQVLAGIDRPTFALAGLVGTLAGMTRPDGLIFCAVAGLWALGRAARGTLPWRHVWATAAGSRPNSRLPSRSAKPSA